MKNISSKSKEIAKAIIFAQIASDGGKYKYDHIATRGNKANNCFYLGYKAKLANILKAIRLIQKSRAKEIYYSVEESLDQNGSRSFITYFTFKMNGQKFQVSFHTPYE